jgi:NAD(P)H-flavin reductase
MSANPRIIKESFACIESSAEKATAYFYGRLFAEDPQLRMLFPPAMGLQREGLFQALTRIVWSLDSPDALAAYLSRLGRAHRKFGVLDEHYGVFGRALIATIRTYAGDSWTPEVEETWTAAYAAVATLMIESADADTSTAPPWWIAKVAGHERRTPDIAVLTVHPNTRLDHAAGQYLAVQTARWPRVWRPYSIANAPRADGSLCLHVRAVPAGWISGTLVRHTRIGDTLLLGPATGSMVLDPDSSRDLLCVAGGTGLAPLKALTEEVIGSRQRRNIHLIVGVRTEDDLYDLADLRALQARYPWLRVIPVVSDDADYDGMRGRVCDVLGRFRDWDDHDVYLAGPAAMITTSVAALREFGVPLARIHHDSPGDSSGSG